MAFTFLIGWTMQDTYYYGSSRKDHITPDDLEKSFFPSTNAVKAFRKENGKPNIVQVRKVFDNADKCRDYEKKVLDKLDVNNKDKWLNTKTLPRGIRTGATHSAESKARMSESKLGVAKTPEHIAKMRNRPQDNEQLTCPHCDKTGDYKNMKRWHMDRCKLNPARLTDADAKEITCTRCGYTALQSPNFYRHHNENCTRELS